MYSNVVHGTVTEVPAWEGHVDSCMLFDNLNFDHSEAKTSAIYFTDGKDICKFFSDEKNVDPSAMIQTIITGNVLPSKEYIIDMTPTDTHHYGGKDYLWPEERNEFYDKLREDGFDAVVITGGYQNANGEICSDIAVLDPKIFTPKSASLKLNGKWTPEMDKQELKGLLVNIANNPDLLMDTMEIGDREVDQDGFGLAY